MNQAEREVEYKRLDQVGRETVNLLHRGQLTEAEFVLRMEAVKAEIDALLAEAVSYGVVDTDWGNPE